MPVKQEQGYIGRKLGTMHVVICHVDLDLRRVNIGIKAVDMRGEPPTERETPWCLAGNGGMDPSSSPYIVPNNSPQNPFPHSLLRTRQERPNSYAVDYTIVKQRRSSAEHSRL